ncbi:hypothetical protein BCR44DRAFT_1436406 [Catenaria anguillulae PL171]|uniref:Uncharacterized protein n=1 Tax=Catenaria anguillulae PL171 TaxID=765915 RepID=A0A1Y2HI72_9FUNG|nr:hypothetical protein BCR44DRAFT_1436406 [Catenaria anguillulae PL171]
MHTHSMHNQPMMPTGALAARLALTRPRPVLPATCRRLYRSIASANGIALQVGWAWRNRVLLGLGNDVTLYHGDGETNGGDDGDDWLTKHLNIEYPYSPALVDSHLAYYLRVYLPRPTSDPTRYAAAMSPSSSSSSQDALFNDQYVEEYLLSPTRSPLLRQWKHWTATEPVEIEIRRVRRRLTVYALVLEPEMTFTETPPSPSRQQQKWWQPVPDLSLSYFRHTLTTLVDADPTLRHLCLPASYFTIFCIDNRHVLRNHFSDYWVQDYGVDPDPPISLSAFLLLASLYELSSELVDILHQLVEDVCATPDRSGGVNRVIELAKVLRSKYPMLVRDAGSPWARATKDPITFLRLIQEADVEMDEAARANVVVDYVIRDMAHDPEGRVFAYAVSQGYVGKDDWPLVWLRAMVLGHKEDGDGDDMHVARIVDAMGSTAAVLEATHSGSVLDFNHRSAIRLLFATRSKYPHLFVPLMDHVAVLPGVDVIQQIICEDDWCTIIARTTVEMWNSPTGLALTLDLLAQWTPPQSMTPSTAASQLWLKRTFICTLFSHLISISDDFVSMLSRSQLAMLIACVLHRDSRCGDDLIRDTNTLAGGPISRQLSRMGQGVFPIPHELPSSTLPEVLESVLVPAWISTGLPWTQSVPSDHQLLTELEAWVRRAVEQKRWASRSRSEREWSQKLVEAMADLDPGWVWAVVQSVEHDAGKRMNKKKKDKKAASVVAEYARTKLALHGFH